MLTDTQRRAVENLASAIIPGARIPQRVFIREYCACYAMDFLQLKLKNIAKIFHALLQHEGSENVVIACFQKTRSVFDQGHVEDWRDDLFFVTPSTEPEAYFAFIQRNRSEFLNRGPGPSVQPPWSVVAEVLGACSDRGSWCIFGQMDAEIALVGFRQRPERSFEERMYAEFRIKRLDDALRDERFFGVPADELSGEWRATLASNYL